MLCSERGPSVAYELDEGSMDWLLGKWTWLIDKALGPVKHWIMRPEQREHDKKIFLLSDELLNEDDVMTRLDELQSFGTFRSKLLNTEKFPRFFRLSGSQYRDRRLKGLSIKVARRLDSLLNCLASHFVVRDALGDTYAEKPNYPEKEHNKFIKERDKKILSFRKTYKKYRESVKKKLNV